MVIKSIRITFGHVDSIAGPLFSDDVPILKEGERIFGLVQSVEGEPMVLTGGARLEVTDASPGHLGFLEIESFDKTRFGANTGRARAIYPGSVVELSDETEAGIRYNADGTWTNPTRGPVEHDLLWNAVDLADNHSPIDFCIPGYGPPAAIAFAVELLLNPATHGDVGLYVPGSQSHWGQKSQLREEYSRYGLARHGIREGETIRLEDVIPTAYISQETVKPSGDTPRDQRLIISKKIEEFQTIDPPEYLITSHVSRIPDDAADVIGQLTSNSRIRSVFRLWSPFTKHEGEHSSRYGPPSADQLSVSTTRPKSQTIGRVNDLNLSSTDLSHPERLQTGSEKRSEPTSDSLPLPATTTDLAGYLDGPSLSSEVIDAPGVQDALSDLFSEYQTFEDVEYYEAANLTFNVQMFFERLPVPVGYYDRWVQDRSFEGEIYLPKSSKKYINDLASHEVEGEGGSLLHATKTAEQIADMLRDDSPLFDRLVEAVEQRISSDETIAIYNSSKKTSLIFREALLEKTSVSESDLDESVQLVNSDSIRTLEPVDELVFCGMQYPTKACFYLHPRATNVTVFVYSEWIQKSVQGHVEEANQALRSFLGVDESTLPLPQLKVSGDPDEEAPEISNSGPVPSSQDDPGPSSSGSGTNGKGTSSSDEESEETEDSPSSTSVPDDLSEQDVRRLQDISELAPTKNGELAEKWGFDSGSDLYQYLSSNLREYYERNHDSLIVLSEEGREILSEMK